MFQKSAFYAGLKIFRSFPFSLIYLKNKKAKFNVALRRYLNTHPFHAAVKYFMLKNDS